MKSEFSSKKGSLARALFCVALACVLLVSVFAVSSFAAGSGAAAWDGKVVSCSTHTAALSPEGDLYVWGSNESGQFPGQDVTYSAEPVEVLSGIADVAVSQGRTLVVTKSGDLKVYGIDPVTEKRQDGSSAFASGVAQVAASDRFAAYITKAGALYTWGFNESGQLGNGSDKSSASPVKVMDSGAKQVDLGDRFALALKDDGSVYGWGSNSQAEFGYARGDSYPASVSSPVKVMDEVSKISAGASYSCFLKENGSLWACGDNTYGQVGAGTLDSYVGLTQILDDVTSMSTGASHCFAIGKDGTVYAWGSGISGQLGTGSTAQVSPAATDLEYTTIFTGRDSTFGVSSDGVISSWGENTNYLLGKDNGSNSHSPLKILDADMKWIYLTANNAEENTGHDHAAETDPSNTTSEPSTEPEPTEPEIVTTPFISGDGNGTFRPNDPVTRAEFLKMLVSAMYEDFDAENGDYGTCSFSDVPLGTWYEKYVTYAETKKQLIAGYEDGTFHPNASITRAEASIMTAKAMGLDTENVKDYGFKDLIENSGANASINALAWNGILMGDGDKTFRPTDTITRAEAVTVVAKAERADLVASTDPVLDLSTAPESFTKAPFTDVAANSWYYAYVLRGVGYIDFEDYMVAAPAEK